MENIKIKNFIKKNKKNLTGKKTNFADSEDAFILKMFLKNGSKWKVISKKLPGRTGN